MIITITAGEGVSSSVSILCFTSSLIVFTFSKEITKGMACVPNAIRNTRTQLCELPVLANCGTNNGTVDTPPDGIMNCVNNSYCKLIPGGAAYKCSCKPGYEAAQDNTICKPLTTTKWTYSLIPKYSALLKKAREPRYRPITRIDSMSNQSQSDNGSDLSDLKLSQAPLLELDANVFAGLLILAFHQVQPLLNLNSLLGAVLQNSRYRKTSNGDYSYDQLMIINFLFPCCRLRRKVSKIILLFLVLLLAPIPVHAWDPSDSETRITNEEKKCPYSTVFNTDTYECNSKIGDPCEVKFNRCGLNTDCLDSQCICLKDFLRAFNYLDCWPAEEIKKDRRNRHEFRQSWRFKDNPENREIECRNNPNFSPKCPALLESLKNNGQTSAKPSALLVRLCSFILAIISIVTIKQ